MARASLLSLYSSFEPLGLCLATLFNIGRGIVSTLVAIGNAVYDFIHFW